MRRLTISLLLLLAACGKGDPDIITPPPPPPPPPPGGATQSVGAAGGTIAISTGELAGTQLVIPAGALARTTTWTFEALPNTDWPRRAGVHPVGEVLHITSGDTGRAAKPMMLTLPVTAVAGSKPFVLMRDKATGAIEVLQTVTVDDGSITVAVQHFDPSWIAPSRSGAGLRAFSSLAGPPTRSYDAQVVVSQIPVAELDKDVDTGFRPGVDDWDYLPLETARNLGERNGGPEVGNVISEMVYYSLLKPHLGALHMKYREFPTLPTSTEVGYRASGEAGAGMPVTTLYAAMATIRNSMRAGLSDQVFYDVLKANMLVSGLPQMVTAFLGETWVPYAAYRVISGKIEMTSFASPGVGTSLTFAAGSFAPLNVVNAFSEPSLADWVGVVAMGQWVKASSVSAMIEGWASGVDSELWTFWPIALLNARGGFVDDTILYLVDDTTRFWVDCRECKLGLASELPGRIEPFSAVFLNSAGAPEALTGTEEGKLLNQVTHTDTRVGIVMYESNGTDDNRWLDYQWFRFKKWVLALPAGLTTPLNTPTTFTATIDGPAAIPEHRFVWTFGSGASAVTAASTALAVTVTLTESGTHPVVIEMRRTSDDKVIALGRSTVTVGSPGWRIDSVGLTVTGATPNSQPMSGEPQSVDEMTTMTQRVLSIPGDGLFFLELDGPVPEQGMYFFIAPAGTGATVTALPPYTRILGPIADGHFAVATRGESFTMTGTSSTGTVGGTTDLYLAFCHNLHTNFSATFAGGILRGTLAMTVQYLLGPRTWTLHFRAQPIGGASGVRSTPIVAGTGLQSPGLRMRC